MMSMQFDGPMFTDDELSCPVRAQVEALTEFRGRRINACLWAGPLVGLLLFGLFTNNTGTLPNLVSFAAAWWLYFRPEFRSARAAWNRFEEARTWSTHRRAP